MFDAEITEKTLVTTVASISGAAPYPTEPSRPDLREAGASRVRLPSADIASPADGLPEDRALVPS